MNTPDADNDNRSRGYLLIDGGAPVRPSAPPEPVAAGGAG